MTQLQIELTLGLFAVVVALGVLAEWLRVAYPILLVVAGLLLGLQPWAPDYSLSPDVVFFLFLPPLLYAAAFNTHWPAFRSQLRAITLPLAEGGRAGRRRAGGRRRRRGGVLTGSYPIADTGGRGDEGESTVP